MDQNSATEIVDTLNQWNLKRLRENEVTLTEAVDSLATDDPLVEVRLMDQSGRWAVRLPLHC